MAYHIVVNPSLNAFICPLRATTFGSQPYYQVISVSHVTIDALFHQVIETL